VDYFSAYASGNLEEVYNVARQALSVDKGGNWEQRVASWAIRINRPKEAVEFLKKLDPRSDYLKEWVYYWGALTNAHHMLGNHKKELKAARKGRKQHPVRLEVVLYEARALAALGRIKKINSLIDESLTLPPQEEKPFQIMLETGQELRAHGHKEASLQVLGRALKWFESRPAEESGSRSHRYGLARVLYEAERWEEAQRVFEGLYEEFSNGINYLGYLGSIAARKGDKEEALRISTLLENSGDDDFRGRFSYFHRACIAALLGEKDSAVRLLREALDKGWIYDWLHPVMDLEPLRDYEPFKELMKPKG
jgi:tetratricopeptide (TPR) repeat protein